MSGAEAHPAGGRCSAAPGAARTGRSATSGRRLRPQRTVQIEFRRLADTDEVVLHDVEGIARKTGVDRHGATWVEFEVDYLAEEQPGTCAICGAEIESGWMCLDGGEEICDDHVRYEGD